MILLIDNYDSFTYNLFQYIKMCGEECIAIRNDKFTIKDIVEMKPSKIVISPGPGYPDDAGLCIDIIKEFYDRIPILGICLGHQCIGRCFGAEVSHAKSLMHGKFSQIHHGGEHMLKCMQNPFPGARYHSLAIIEKSLPDEIDIFARTDDGEIMAIKHRDYPVYGLQFHPESILTPGGLGIIREFLKGEDN